jgi:hypothetical protein
VLRLGNGTAKTITGLSPHALVLARFTVDRFLLALVETATVAKLWHVSLTGSATLIGSYVVGARLPYWRDAKLDASGAAVAFTNDRTDAFHDRVERFTVSGPPTMLHDEKVQTVKIHGSTPARA